MRVQVASERVGGNPWWKAFGFCTQLAPFGLPPQLARLSSAEMLPLVSRAVRADPWTESLSGWREA
eukprot:12504573-Alexandrium_andersonii.AAC.1